MKSAVMNTGNTEKLMKSESPRNRPYLSIITTPKKTWKKFLTSTKQTLSPSSSNSLSTPPSLSKSNTFPSPASFDSPSSNTDQLPDPLRVKPIRTNSDDTLSAKSTTSFQSSFKKFHFPQLSIRSNKKIPQDELFTPVPPEPIMPTLLDWSPEEPVSPPPWEQDDFDPLSEHKILKHHSLTDNISYHSDCELDIVDTQSSESTLVDETRLRRRSSCPIISRLSLRTTTSSSSTLVENDIMSITEEHTRHAALLKKNNVVEKQPVLKSCQKAKAKAAQAAAQGETVHNHPFFSTVCDDNLKYLHIPNVFDPKTRVPVLKFTDIKPRKYRLRRKVNWKREAKALMKWHHSLETLLEQPSFVTSLTPFLPPEKMAKNLCTRRFIIKELFTTEVSFWNQLYYTKMIYYDALEYSYKYKTEFARLEDSDIFANLFDLMQFSAKLINRLRRVRFGSVNQDIPSCAAAKGECVNIDCNSLPVGSILLDMAEDFVVFLRCAIDYKDNQKQVDENERHGYYAHYKKRLYSRKETSQFTMKDYLIIPIQRVARYGLLIADLIRHTPPEHADYLDLIRAHQVVTSLATAMNLAQKKLKKT